MDPKEFQKEHKFLYEEFEILISFANNYFILEALNKETFQNYILSLTDDEIFKISHNYFSKTSELFETLTNFFDESNENNETPLPLTKGLVIIKFKKKTLSLQFKIQLQNEPQPKTLNFSLDLIPKNPNKELKSVQTKIDDLATRLAKIESYLLDFKTVNERISALEQKYQDFADHKPNPTAIVTNNSTQWVDPGPILSFAIGINSNYFTFKNKSSMVIRGSASRKSHIVAWGSTPLKKKGLQFFYYKIEGLNKGFQYINACIGVMTGNLYGKVVNLAEHDGNGCYFYGVNAQCIWINNTKSSVEAKYGKEGDVFKVMLNFDNLSIVWQHENKEIGRGNIDEKQVEMHEFYPAVTLAYPRESISLI